MLPKIPMKFVSLCATSTLLLWVALSAISAAQSASQDSIQDATRSGRVCTSADGASRISTTCDGEKTTVLRSEAELTTTVRLAAPELAFCTGEISLEYEQWDTMAHVEGQLENKTCAASAGEYEIVVRVKDDSGELQTLEFAESWRRSDDQPVMLMADYPIGENVELIRLSSRRLRCRCLDSAAE